MSKFLSAAATALVAGSLLLAPTGSAFEAPKPPSPSSTTTHGALLSDALTAHVESYDPVTHVATLSGTADWYKGSFSVEHNKADGTRVDSEKGISLVDPETGEWTVKMPEVFAGDTFRITNGISTPSLSLPATGAVGEPAATVTTSVRDGVVSGVLTFARSGLIEIRDPAGKALTGTKLADNWNAPAGTPFTYRFSLPDTGSAASYTAAVAYAFADHTTVDFAITGARVATATIDDVAPSSDGRAVVRAAGQPGATIAVKAGDTVVGIKHVGTSGTVSVPVPIDDEAVNDLTATQTLNGQKATTDEVKYVAPPAHAELAYVEDHGFTLGARFYVQAPLNADEVVFRDSDGKQLRSIGSPNNPGFLFVKYEAGSTRTISASTVINGVESSSVPIAVRDHEQGLADPEVRVEKVTTDTISVRIKATPHLGFVARAETGKWFHIGGIVGYGNPDGSFEKGTLLEIPRSEFTGSRLMVGTYVESTPFSSEWVSVTIPGI